MAVAVLVVLLFGVSAALGWRRKSVAGLAGAALLLGVVGGALARPARTAGAEVISGPRVALGSLPAQAQPVVSSALGSGQAAYAAAPSGTGFRLSGGGVTAALGRGVVTVHAGGGVLTIVLAGLGRGARPAAVGAVAPVATGNRVSYPHRGVAEWYEAGPLGIEQGFTLARRPGGAGGPVTLTLRLGGTLRGTRDGTGVQFTAPSGSSLRYEGLLAVDASGRKLPAALKVRGRSLLVQVSDRGARYPLRIDPFIQQGNKLTPSDETYGFLISSWGRFGYSAALSADGNTALIGCPLDNDGNGAAWIFTRTNGVWAQQGSKLTVVSTSGNVQFYPQFGTSVALSADGNTALIGGSSDNFQTGAAWVFIRSSGNWTQQGSKLTGNGEAGAGLFGSSVTLSTDGNTALVGGYGDNGFVGAAWVFTRSGATWSTGTKLTASGEDNSGGGGSFGGSVALSADGNTGLVGGFFDKNGVGAAWVFTRSGGVWAQQGAKLTGSGEGGAGHFGGSVALSADGNTALMGGDTDNGNFGAAWVFTRSGAVWSQQGAKLTGSGESATGQLGHGVALSADGNTALVGGFADNASAGAAWVFTRSGGVWAQQGSKLTGSDLSSAAELGWSVALSGDGNTALIGGPSDNDFRGAAWVFAVGAVVSSPTTLSFGSQTIQEAGAVNWLPVENTGTAPLLFTGSAQVTGANAADFTIPAGDDLCALTTLDPGFVCWIGVRFTASVAGAESATLSFGASNASRVPTVSLSGSGLAYGPAQLLPAPVRAYDSRTDPAGKLSGGAVLGTAGTPRVIQIAGAVPGVPANAIAVVGNLTVTEEAGNGFATIWPSGTWPGTSNINFSAASDRANSFTVALSNTGTVSVAASASTHVIIDITGYIL